MRIVLIDLLGGLGDLVMVLPSIHALAGHHPGAELTVLTHAPGAPLLAHDPAVTEVRTAVRGAERAAVEHLLDEARPDLTVTTTRFDGIGDLVEEDARRRGTRAVADLWRRPPADELVGHRYLRILAAEGVVAPEQATDPSPPRIALTDAERRTGHEDLDGAEAPIVLVPDAGMNVKRWSAARWTRLAALLRPRPVLSVGPVDGATELVPTDLRGLAGRFAAVAGRCGAVVGPDTGPVRVAAAVGARTVGLFGPTVVGRYGLETGINLQGLPECPHRRPTAITEQVCWWDGYCPLSDTGAACLLDLDPARVAAAVTG